MKAISIRQPWADLIVQGRKTLELRSWTVSYRGPMAIHASQTIERELCQLHGMDPGTVTAGAVIGIVDLVDIIQLDQAAFEARRAEHLDAGGYVGGFTPPLYGWRLANPSPLAEPWPMRGRMGLFNAPDDAIDRRRSQASMQAGESIGASPERYAVVGNGPERGASRRPGNFDVERPFELRVVRSDDAASGAATSYRLALYQQLTSPNQADVAYHPAEATMQRVSELGGTTLRSVADHILEALRLSGYRATDLSAARREPFRLNEESGVRLGLLFVALRPVTKSRRIEAISHGLRSMTSEEAYYWYSKCTAGAGMAAAAERAQKALRVLLADE